MSTWQPPIPAPLRADLYTATHAPATRSCPALQTIQVHTKYKQTNHLTNVIDRGRDSVGTLFIPDAIALHPNSPSQTQLAALINYINRA